MRDEHYMIRLLDGSCHIVLADDLGAPGYWIDEYVAFENRNGCITHDHKTGYVSLEEIARIIKGDTILWENPWHRMITML
jgi:hypothetical protein